jgi:hypothetical protein
MRINKAHTHAKGILVEAAAPWGRYLKQVERMQRIYRAA